MEPFFAYLSSSYCFPLPPSFTLAHSWWVIHHRRPLSFLWLGWLAGLTGWLAGWLARSLARSVSDFLAPGPAYLAFPPAPSFDFLPRLILLLLPPPSRFSDLCTRFTPTLEPYQHAVLARQGALSRCWLIAISPAHLSLLAHPGA